MKNLLGLCLVLFSLIACATAPVPRQIQNAFPIEKPFDSVWTALVETFAELNLVPIQNMDKASGLITTDWISFAGQKNETGYCDCGGLGVEAYEADRLGKFNVLLKKTSDTACEVKINSTFEQRYQAVGMPNLFTRPCVSTGKLEAEIFRLIFEKAK